MSFFPCFSQHIGQQIFVTLCLLEPLAESFVLHFLLPPAEALLKLPGKITLLPMQAFV